MIYLDNSATTNPKPLSVIKAVDETGLASDMPEKICPECGSPMIVRRSRFGKLFYGCSTFPKCRGIVNV